MSRKILIIDDEPDILTFLSVLLEDFDYEVISATNAADAFVLAKREFPDLICLDVMMPKRSGIALYKDLKQDAQLSSIPTIIISAVESAHSFTGPKFRQIVKNDSIPEPLAFFEKPIEPDQFVDFISSLFAGREKSD